MRDVVAIDPGTTRSALCFFGRGVTPYFETFDNERMLAAMQMAIPDERVLAIEMIASYGMPVGREVFETCVWIGRFIEAWGGPWEFVYRKDVKLHLCNSVRAKDANVAQALRDRFGEKGTKAKPGKLYGIRGDEWAALAVAVTYWDTHVEEQLREAAHV